MSRCKGRGVQIYLEAYSDEVGSGRVDACDTLAANRRWESVGACDRFRSWPPRCTNSLGERERIGSLLRWPREAVRHRRLRSIRGRGGPDTASAVIGGLMVDSLSRREFLESAALIGAASAAGGVEPAPQPAGWYDRPMRWAQLTLVENDPGRYDPKFWLDYFA